MLMHHARSGLAVDATFISFISQSSRMEKSFHRLSDARTSVMLKHTELCIFLCKLVHIKPCT